MSSNDHIIALRKDGVGPREIARRLCISPNRVAGVLFRAGLTKPTGGRGNGVADDVKRKAIELYWKEGGRAAAAFAGVTGTAVQRWAQAS